MPRLTDVLGAIMADIAAARRVADLQTLRIAKQYRDDPLLRGMTVPRIRLPEVVLDLPLMIESCEGGQASTAAPKPTSPPTPGPVVARPQDLSASIVNLGSDVLRRLKDSETTAGIHKPQTSTRGAPPSDELDAESVHRFPSLNVIVTAEELKTRGETGSGGISRLRLVIREEGLEWSHDDGDDDRGEDRARLLPE